MWSNMAGVPDAESQMEKIAERVARGAIGSCALVDSVVYVGRTDSSDYVPSTTVRGSGRGSGFGDGYESLRRLFDPSITGSELHIYDGVRE